MNYTVIAHNNCSDGYCSAWVAKNKLEGHEVLFHFADYYTEPPWDKIDGRDVYILDYSYSREQTLEIYSRTKSLIIIDHHVSHQHELEGLTFAHFDMHRSGAGMTFDYLYNGYPRPWIVNYVEDRDIWKKALPDTDIVNAYLSALPFEFSAWDKAAATPFDEVLSKGTAILDSIKRYVQVVKQNAVIIEFEGYKVPFINAQKPFISELLNEIRQGHPFALGWFMSVDGFEYSLRSGGDVDVSELAKLYKGGGHRASAGFKTASPLAHITQHRFK